MSAPILAAATPARWVDAAAEGWRPLLTDHANCEKKAASTALSLIFAYPEDTALTLRLARIAREELRHFEQVTKLMRELGVPFERQTPGRYGQGLRALARSREPARKLDLLLLGALIEARSCERFELLAPRLPGRVGEFYADLARAEARHYEEYMTMAQQAAPGEDIGTRMRELALGESKLATAPDVELRFHSGPPDRVAEFSPAGAAS